jgi:hypothetical protein
VARLVHRPEMRTFWNSGNAETWTYPRSGARVRDAEDAERSSEREGPSVSRVRSKPGPGGRRPSYPGIGRLGASAAQSCPFPVCRNVVLSQTPPDYLRSGAGLIKPRVSEFVVKSEFR